MVFKVMYRGTETTWLRQTDWKKSCNIFLGLKILNKTLDMNTISQCRPDDGFVDDGLTIS